MKNIALHTSLKKRGLSFGKLAVLANVGRAHLSQVLANVPGRGFKTRHKLFLHLTEEEIGLLGWTEEYQVWKKNRPENAAAPRREQSSTENIVPPPAEPAEGVTP